MKRTTHINLKDIVVFTPTKLGRDILEKEDHEGGWKQGVTLHMMRRDDFRYETTLWHFMSLFGASLTQGCVKQLIVNNQFEIISNS